MFYLKLNKLSLINSTMNQQFSIRTTLSIIKIYQPALNTIIEQDSRFKDLFTKNANRNALGRK